MLLGLVVFLALGTVLTAPGSPNCTIKGAVLPSGERVYFLPDHARYARIADTRRTGEQWFCTEWEAWFAGWRKAAD